MSRDGYVAVTGVFLAPSLPAPSLPPLGIGFTQSPPSPRSVERAPGPGLEGERAGRQHGAFAARSTAFIVASSIPVTARVPPEIVSFTFGAEIVSPSTRIVICRPSSRSVSAFSKGLSAGGSAMVRAG